MIRDRKMYVAPTPFGLASGVAHQQTLILPESFPVTSALKQVGTLVRKEADRLIVSYILDLRHNILKPKTIPNPSAGREHIFQVWRLESGSDEPVVMHEAAEVNSESDKDDTEE